MTKKVKLADNFGVWVHIKQEDLAAIKPDSDLRKRAEQMLKERYSEEGREIVDYAMENMHKDSDFEVDHDAAISAGDEGAYVMGWSWIDYEDLERTKRVKN
jgi:hypothetical protein